MKQTELYEKEGQVGGAIGATIQLIIGVGVAVLVLIFVGVLGGQAFQLSEAQIDALTRAVRDEAFTPINSTEVFLANDNIIEGTLQLFNTTETFNTGMFNVDYATGGVTLTNDTINATSMFANYTEGEQAAKDSIKGAIVSGFKALEQTGDYLPLIVLAIVIFLILVLVLGFTTLGNIGGGGRTGTVL